VTLDIQMPYLSGIDLLKKVFIPQKIPCLMISALGKDDGPQVLEALSLGAFDYLQKPSLDFLEQMKFELYEKLIHGGSVSQKKNTLFSQNILKSAQGTSKKSALNQNYLIAIGSSTGGTQALQDILTTLPSQIPPIVITQHIPEYFSKAFADRVNELCPFTIKEAEEGEELTPNKVLIAPGGKHMAIIMRQEKLYAKITDDPPVNRFKPSVDYLFSSIAKLIIDQKISAQRTIGVILTGMGRDGAEGMLQLKDLGVRTIAQDEATCVVFGMPKRAIELNAVTHIVALPEISSKLADLCV
jgi:two-component system, chemotaxis family, protein-glutamate methylesterase/glutaminase